jgi:hypothetical protein
MITGDIAVFEQSAVCATGRGRAAGQHAGRGVEVQMSRQNEYRKRHPERVKDSQRRWREQNREHLREYNKQYKRDNQKDYRERQKVAMWRSIVGVWSEDDEDEDDEDEDAI